MDTEYDSIDCDDFIIVNEKDKKGCENCIRFPSCRNCEEVTEVEIQIIAVEACADCGAAPDESTRFGGFNRPLCLECRGKENARIDRFCELYGEVPAEESPDMRDWLELQRISGL